MLKVLIVGIPTTQVVSTTTPLSQRRAEALVKALAAKYGIDAKRMQARVPRLPWRRSPTNLPTKAGPRNRRIRDGWTYGFSDGTPSLAHVR